MNFYYWLGYHFSRLFARFLYGFRIVHRERVIQTGPVILAINHQSFLDPPLAGNAADRAIFFLAQKSLMDVAGICRRLTRLHVMSGNFSGDCEAPYADL